MGHILLRELRRLRASILRDFAEHLLAQNVVYAEVNSIDRCDALRGQNPQANFDALLEAADPFESRGLRLNWIFDAVRQFGVDAAMEVVEAAAAAVPQIVAFGIGGDELSVPTAIFAVCTVARRIWAFTA